MIFGRLAASYYAFKGNLEYQKGNVQESINYLSKAYKTRKAKTLVVTAYGYVLLKSGYLEESIKIFKEQLSSTSISNSDRFNVKANYALALWKDDKMDEAIALYEEILPYYKTTNIYGSLGFLYILKGDLEKALKFNLDAYDYNNTNGVILDNLGQSYYLLGEYEKAEEIYIKLMALNPKFPEAYYDFALVYEKLGNTEKCIEKLRNALVYKTNFLSAITTEQIEAKLAEVENLS